MKQIRILCRDSRLSLIQARMTRDKVLAARPDTEVIILTASSRGDREQDIPLSSLDGTDFFTQEISAALQRGEAELAVHSLKDMSAPHFFSHDAFAVIDRDDVRDIAIFRPSIMEKLRRGEPIVIGTCSPRREDMAMAFLKKALPQLGPEINITVSAIRGNVEGRLRQVDEGKYDGTILATAGLNRLWRDEEAGPVVKALLADKKTMLLPLFECAPAPCQAAIVVEADPNHTNMRGILDELNQPQLAADARAEKRLAWGYGTGCLQRFGVVTVHAQEQRFLYAAGVDQHGQSFMHWEGLPALEFNEEELFSSSDHMASFFTYEAHPDTGEINTNAVFIANHKALQYGKLSECIRNKRVWVSGTRTWLELARAGIWVEGSADALGFASMLSVWDMPLIRQSSKDITIVTHRSAAERWEAKGYEAIAAYDLGGSNFNGTSSDLGGRTYYFWTSYAQWDHYGRELPSTAVHICTSGETAALMQKAGLSPVVFPTIRSFEWWRKRIGQAEGKTIS